MSSPARPDHVAPGTLSWAPRRPGSFVLAVFVAFVLLAGSCTGDDGGAPSEPDEAADASQRQAPSTLPPLGELEPLEDGVARIGVVGLTTIDPADVTPGVFADLVVNDLIHGRLTAWDPITAAAVPSLAERWDVDDDARTWTFVLRDDAVFSDGSAVHADDVKASLERVVKRGTGSLPAVRLDVLEGHEPFQAGDAEDLVGIEVLDERTVVLRTTEPYAALPELLSAVPYAIVPTEATETAGAVDTVVSAGAWQVADNDWRTLHLEPSVDGGGGALEGVEVVVFDDLDQALGAHEDGLVDVAMVPGAALAPGTQIMGETEVGAPALRVPLGVSVFFAFDLGDGRVDDVALREAIAVSLDRAPLLDGPLAGNLPAHGVLAMAVPGASSEPCGACVFDPERAEALATGLGITAQSAPVMVDTYDDPFEAALGEALVASMRAAGIPAGLRQRPYDEYEAFVAARTRRLGGDTGTGGGAGRGDDADAVGDEPAGTLLEPGDRQVFLFAWAGVAGEPDGTLGALYRSGSTDNVTGFDDPLVDLALLSARRELDPALRWQTAADAERAVMAQVPIVPVTTLAAPVALSERIDGVLVRPDGTLSLAVVQLGS